MNLDEMHANVGWFWVKLIDMRLDPALERNSTLACFASHVLPFHARR
jgi:hypothetical protein